jgi:hypothetical protein
MTTVRQGAIFDPMRSPSRLPLLIASLLVMAPCFAVQPSAAADEQVAMQHGRFASVGGLWCGEGLLHGFSLEIAQDAQNVQGRLVRKERVREITGHVEGARVITDAQRDHTMELLAEGDKLRIVTGTGVLALAAGQSFARAVGGSCSG